MDLFEYEPSARELADQGARQAADHADRVVPEWSAQALAAVERYAKTHASFMIEDARVWAHQNGLPAAPDPRAWGHVAKAVVRERIATITGYALTKIKPAHAGPRAVYASLIFGGVQVVS